MNFKHSVAALGVLALIGGSPALASAQIQSGPIEITKLTPGFASVEFVNQYGEAATDVVFAIRSRTNGISHFDDVGYFSPGTTIVQRIPEGPVDEFASIAVEDVMFADGTVWHNPDIVVAHDALP